MKWLEKLNKLVEENPDAQVLHMVAIEEFTDDFGRMATDNITVELTKYILWHTGEMITNEEGIKDNLAYSLVNEISGTIEWSDENLDFAVDEKYNEFITNNPWTKAIYVNVG